jgi:hypothetical protein
MIAVLTHVAAFVAGSIVAWATAFHFIRKREAPGHVSRGDFSWPGKPLHIIEAEAIDAALRGDL